MNKLQNNDSSSPGKLMREPVLEVPAPGLTLLLTLEAPALS